MIKLTIIIESLSYHMPLKMLKSHVTFPRVFCAKELTSHLATSVGMRNHRLPINRYRVAAVRHSYPSSNVADQNHRYSPLLLE